MDENVEILNIENNELSLEGLEKDINKDIRDATKVAVDEMKRRISNGEVIKDYTRKDKERIVVTKTEDGKYGYMAYRQNKDEPYYYAEGSELLEDLDKITNNYGTLLMYNSAQSTIQRNLTGMFTEFIDEPPAIQTYYVNIKLPETSEARLGWINGHDPEEAIQIMAVNFVTKRVSFATNVEIAAFKDDKPMFRIGHGELNKDGTVKYEDAIDGLYYSEFAKPLSGGIRHSRHWVEERYKKTHENSLKLLYPMYKLAGIAMPDDIEPNTLLIDLLAGKKGTVDEILAITEVDKPEQLLEDKKDNTSMDDIINKKYNTDLGYKYFYNQIKTMYPYLNLNEENLKNLKIETMDEEYHQKTNFVGEYVAKNNTIKIYTNENNKYNENEINDDTITNTFLHEFIHSATSKYDENNDVTFEGLNIRKNTTKESSYFEGISEGITQMLTNEIMGVEISDAYPIETQIAKQIANIIGKEKLLELYSDNNYKGFYEELSKYLDEERAKKLIVNINELHNVCCGLTYGNDILGTNIQKELIEMKKNSGNYSDDFKELLFTEEMLNKYSKLLPINTNNPSDFGFEDIDEVSKEYNPTI